MGYGELIQETLRITWRNRYLWFFGLFATTSYSVSFNVSGESESTDAGSGAALSGLEIAIAVVLLLLFVLWTVLAVISQAALTSAVAASSGGERLAFRAAWRAGAGRFWGVLGLALLFLAVGLLALVVVLAR